MRHFFLILYVGESCFLFRFVVVLNKQEVEDRINNAY